MCLPKIFAKRGNSRTMPTLRLANRSDTSLHGYNSSGDSCWSSAGWIGGTIDNMRDQPHMEMGGQTIAGSTRILLH
jgi:hypothetical protein